MLHKLIKRNVAPALPFFSLNRHVCLSSGHRPVLSVVEIFHGKIGHHPAHPCLKAGRTAQRAYRREYYDKAVVEQVPGCVFVFNDICTKPEQPAGIGLIQKRQGASVTILTSSDKFFCFHIFVPGAADALYI